MINLHLFFGHDRDLPPPQEPWGGFFGQLVHVILGGSPYKFVTNCEQYALCDQDALKSRAEATFRR